MGLNLAPGVTVRSAKEQLASGAYLPSATKSTAVADGVSLVVRLVVLLALAVASRQPALLPARRPPAASPACSESWAREAPVGAPREALRNSFDAIEVIDPCLVARNAEADAAQRGDFAAHGVDLAAE